MSVIHVKTDEEFQELIEKYETCLVDFSASWCGPCRMIAPFFEQKAAENPKIKFLKIDVDELEKVAQSANIRAMPTFIIYKNGALTNDVVRGANKDGILELIERNLPSAPPTPPVVEESEPEPDKESEPEVPPTPSKPAVQARDNYDKDNDSEKDIKSENKCTCCVL